MTGFIITSHYDQVSLLFGAQQHFLLFAESVQDRDTLDDIMQLVFKQLGKLPFERACQKNQEIPELLVPEVRKSNSFQSTFSLSEVLELDKLAGNCSSKSMVLAATRVYMEKKYFKQN